MSEYKEYGYSDEQATWSHQYIIDAVLELIGTNKDQKILDLGCGNGAIVNFLLAKGYDVYGIDASVEGIDLAKKTNPNNFFVQDLSNPNLPSPLDKMRFNTIISTEVIEHLYDPRLFVKFAKKILFEAGGGQLILTTPYHGYLKNLFLSLAGKWDSHADPLWDGGHIKLWSKKTLTTLLEEQNFVVTDFIGCGRFAYVWKSMAIKAKFENK